MQLNYFVNSLALLTPFWFQIRATNYDIFLERTDGIAGEKSTLIDFSNLKFTRANGKHYVNGFWIHHVDMDETYYLMVELEYSSQRNKDFVKHPFKVPKTNACEYFNTTYKKYTMDGFIGHSNFPIIPPEGLCPIPKGKFWVKDVEYQTNMLPPHMPEGFWKLEEIYYNPQDEVIGGSRFYMRLAYKDEPL